MSFGSEEVFSALADSIESRLKLFGVKTTVEIGNGLYHCYAASPLVKEAQPGYEAMIDFLKEPKKSRT
jgi:hypothetical protein